METGWDGSECWANKMAGNVVDNCPVLRWAAVGVVGTRLVTCLIEDSRKRSTKAVHVHFAHLTLLNKKELIQMTKSHEMN